MYFGDAEKLGKYRNDEICLVTPTPGPEAQQCLSGDILCSGLTKIAYLQSFKEDSLH